MNSPTYLASGVRSAFCKVDGPLRAFDAIQLSVPIVQAMAAVTRPDLLVWGSVIPSLRWSNIAREVLMDAKLGRHHSGVFHRQSVFDLDGRRIRSRRHVARARAAGAGGRGWRR